MNRRMRRTVVVLGEDALANARTAQVLEKRGFNAVIVNSIGQLRTEMERTGAAYVMLAPGHFTKFGVSVFQTLARSAAQADDGAERIMGIVG